MLTYQGHHMKLIKRTPSTSANPVEADDLAAHLRVTSTEAISALRYADVAAHELEDYAAIALLDQEIVAQGQPDERGVAYLPIGPAPAQTPTVETLDGTALPHLFTPGRHPVVTLAEPYEGEIRVTYQAGYGQNTSAIPADLQHAVLDQTMRLYDMRGDMDAPATPAPAFARIAARHRRVSLGS
jgi:uncharacterized phiE125 gp8 family phage protein